MAFAAGTALGPGGSRQEGTIQEALRTACWASSVHEGTEAARSAVRMEADRSPAIVLEADTPGAWDGGLEVEIGEEWEAFHPAVLDEACSVTN